MTPLDALLLGVVEGVTEFLPISSTGHLILTSSLLHIADSEFLKTFEIAIQLGAILAVVALYWRSLLNIEILKRVIIGFIPTGVIGLALYKVVKTYLLGSEVVVLWALALGGLALIAFELWHSESENAASDITEITYRQAVLVGLFQALAIIPGVSRSAATILGGLFVGIKRAAIVQFSFLLAVPTMVSATGLDLIKNTGLFSSDQALLLGIGFVTSFFVALAAIKFLLSFVKSHSFVSFGVYRILVACLFFWLVF
ncbi:undecaprenyl-diphosphatase UppP [Candidatus Adlerbacteria bacterium RIFCSPHIGHO2_02_FULL_54_18]|uniref:Undecaprenyl-diphosphatase n=2 Tax=Candidatus Adleribacteriota TaxID=1752736 RepID=A0A1F4Y215_9BACT|nr:MAG: undecaprenyl-diphosphatase UppP [Candidatus Adlerbacteria bacterium RIFCSPLOWO2_01_FULL_54_21b]OGC87941.1 MAG: undecaprenyl-diphosphatase UppP [Candidatus Adlerbacteria bacterium RIFCSPHIGHO2_02_FULL_54_18]